MFDQYDKSTKCRDWPGPGAGAGAGAAASGEHRVYFVDPMREFVDSHTEHVDETFERFKVGQGEPTKDEFCPNPSCCSSSSS